MRRATVVLATFAFVLGTAACSSSGHGSAGGSATSSPSSTTQAGGGATTSAAATGSTTSSPAAGSGAEAAYKSKLYDGTQHWICHPDLPTDDCRPQAEVVVAADGTATHLAAKPASPASRPIDCFYIYPTVSPQPGLNSDLQMGDSERSTVRAQVARYSSVCRVFAPVYRQVTLKGIFAGGLGGAGRTFAYGDVLDAWRTYLAQQNHGRGVVLIGHSQGASLLIKLIAEQIDPKPAVRSRLVSAILMGGSVAVPIGKDVGGTFQHIPACRAATQTGCVITFSSFPAAAPPGLAALFGRDPAPGQQSLCVDPVALAGGNGLADTVVPRRAVLIAAVTGLPAGPEPYIGLPGTLTARCVRVNGHTVLAYARASATDRRPVDSLLKETLGPLWGLHLYDANLPQDDLIQIVGRQGIAWKPSN
ncbi:MAG: lysophospholipase [Acidimicrobiales bacterium]|nr:lysophospholipase [Acidimicrobiales bacterium]